MDTLLTALGPSAPERTLRLTNNQASLMAGLFEFFDPPIGPLEIGEEYSHEETEAWGITLSRALDESRIYRSVTPASNTGSTENGLREFLGATSGPDITDDMDVLEQRFAISETGPNAEHYPWVESLADFLLDCEGLSVESVES
jgi:hypothetical protein